MGISITDKGTKTFIVYRKIEGKPERAMLGHFPDLSVENARDMAMEVNTKISKGSNPRAEKHKLANMPTLGFLFTEHLKKYAKIHKKSWKGDYNLYNYYLWQISWS